jgi:hypothetical protein
MKAYELLSDESKWAKKSYAYETTGGPCDPRSETACSWCVMGAIERCYFDGNMSRRHMDAIYKVETKVGSVPIWNDAKERTYEEVIALLKELDI